MNQTHGIWSVVYAPSYQGVLLTLHLYTFNKQIIVITANLSVKNFLESQDILVLYYKPIAIRISSFQSFVQAKRLAEWIFTELSIYNINALVFYHNACDIFGFYFISLWAKYVDREVWFSPMDPIRNSLNILQIVRNPKNLFRFFLIRILLPLPCLRVVRSSVSDVFGIDTAFLKNINAIPYPYGSPNTIRKEASEKFAFLQDLSIIILGSFSLTQDEYLILYDILVQISFLPYPSFYKPHPSERISLIPEPIISLSPSIPAELLISPNTVIIGDHSASMIYAIDQHKTHVISFSKILYGSNSSKFKVALSFLNTASQSANIYYPESINDLLSILHDVL